MIKLIDSHRRERHGEEVSHLVADCVRIKLASYGILHP